MVCWSVYSLSNGKRQKAFVDFKTILHNIDFASFARLFICFVSWSARATTFYDLWQTSQKMLRAKGAKNGTLGKRYILKLIHFEAEKFAHIPHIQEAKKLEI